ncbi:MAG: aminotransferase class V-fold PLP-dependent enzyme [Planctomycetota bacterium]
MADRLYLDNAATSFPKPPRVTEAMVRYAAEIGASPGRGGYREAQQGSAILVQCRAAIARLIHAGDPDQIAFALNTSDALNLAIKGLVLHRRRLDPDARIHLVTTAMDHNSVLRPFNALAAFAPGQIRWTCVPVDADGVASPHDIAAAMTSDTLLVAVVHASNATGSIQPIAGIGRLCRAAGVPLLVDAAQSLGHLPVDVEQDAIDLLAFPGHKGLLGPLGTGGLWIHPGLEERIDPLREGGTGTISESDVHPTAMPAKFEPGSHNTIGIAGLLEGVRWLLDRGVDDVRNHEIALIERMIAGLRDLPGVRLLGPADPARRVGVFALIFEGQDPHAVADRLEREFGLLVRAGIHCAPRAHGAMGTLDDGGAVRLSIGQFTTEADVDRALAAIAAIAADHLAPA